MALMVPRVRAALLRLRMLSTAAEALPEACERCAAAARARGVDVAIRIFEQPLPTAADAASALGVTPAQITNSLLFELKQGGERQPILILAPGDRKVDTAKVSALLGVSKNKVKGASAEAVLAYTGYQAGGVAPCGHLQAPTHCFIDERVFQHDECWLGGGVKPAMFSCTPDQLVAISGGARADVGLSPPTESS